ncbi:MAG: hypothetical protein NE334_01720 [Lentisphaeraceae bacterium]|nr:hypothetical protein [Lentisphaeraceae bacterium]
MYFSEGITSNYPSNPQEVDIDRSILNTRKYDSDLQLPKDWQIPNNWQEFNDSNSAYAFLRNPEEEYTGSAINPMFIIKQNYHSNLNCRQAVFEDGHVECIPEEEAIALWKKAGVWNKN